ncbi:MAG: type VII secretion protein EssA [Streptococcaceae bacterium]|jgi:type VII secretion protein EssA|nr:type VII secretion protein EssA [Streptococcaceae bacterium]
MKKKTIILFLALLCGVIFLTGRGVFADDNGKLQLDPNVITNSNGGVGTASDFPILGDLFTSGLNQTAKEQMQDKVPEQKKVLDFSKQSANTLYDTNTAQITTQLFVNYSPQVMTSSTDTKNTQSTVWYWLLSLAALPLVFLAIFLGRKNAKRSLRRKK